MNRGRRELLAALGGALIVVSVALPWLFIRSWLGAGPIVFSRGTPVSGFQIVERWPFAVGALIVASSFLEWRRGVSMAWTVLGLGAIELWQFGAVALHCSRGEIFGAFEPTACNLGAGLFFALLGSGAALVAGALGLRAEDRAPTSWPHVIKMAGRRSAKALVDFHEHRHDF
jgi:hypothetical protein